MLDGLMTRMQCLAQLQKCISVHPALLASKGPMQLAASKAPKSPEAWSVMQRAARPCTGQFWATTRLCWTFCSRRVPTLTATMPMMTHPSTWLPGDLHTPANFPAVMAPYSQQVAYGRCVSNAFHPPPVLYEDL